MSIHRKPGHTPAFAGVSGLRRRVIFELDPEQLPLLDAVRERHSSTRAALIAALEAEGELTELRERLEQAEQRAEKAEKEKAARAAKRQKDDGAAKRLTEQLAGAKGRAADLEAELKEARGQHALAKSEARREEEGYEEVLAELKDEVAELKEREVDWLYCARCRQWVPPKGWAWQRIKGGGRYAYHRECGDHKPGLTPSSWLAQRA